MKFLLQDLPQICIKVLYLTKTDCGLKNPNYLVVIGIVLALINSYFGFFYRLVNVCYSVSRLNSLKRRIQVVVSNSLLSTFGFRNLKDKVYSNKKIESLIFEGENYEYFHLNERSVAKFAKFMEIFPNKEIVQFIEAKRVKFESVRQAKALFVAIDNNYHQVKYLTLQECSLCTNFILQLKSYIDGNTSLLRISMVMNKMKQSDVLDAINTCFDHPNLEII